MWLSEILEGSRDAIFLADEQAAFVHVNQAACDLSGYGRDELLRMRIPDLHDEADLEAFRLHFASLLDGASGITEAVLRRKDGSRVPVEFSNRGVQIEGARFLHTVARDISDRVQARRDAALVRALASRLAEAETAERGRLAIELHDRVGQTLTALGINFALLRMEIAGRVPDRVWRLDFLQSLIEDTVACVRDVMANLRPPMLDDYGPVSALRAWVKHLSSLAPVEIAIDADDPNPRLPPAVENALFRIGQEALSNVVKHAQASRATVSIEIDAASARLIVADNGRGFTVPDGGVGDEHTWGLLSMSERARAVGGRLSIESRPGRGTRVVVEVERNSA